MNKFDTILEGALSHLNVDNKMVDAAFEVLKRIKGELGEEALIVGGSVRDIIMGKEPHDIDIASAASPQQTETIFKTHDIGKSKDFGIVVVQQDGFSLCRGSRRWRSGAKTRRRRLVDRQ